MRKVDVSYPHATVAAIVRLFHQVFKSEPSAVGVH